MNLENNSNLLNYKFVGAKTVNLTRLIKVIGMKEYQTMSFYKVRAKLKRDVDGSFIGK